MFKVKEEYRVKNGILGSDESFGNNGAFIVKRIRTTFVIIASDGEGWEHVSVHCVNEGKERTPSLEEMCFVKGLFWGEEDCVIQYHPAKSEYVNLHKHTLHMWRPSTANIPTPHKLMIGF